VSGRPHWYSFFLYIDRFDTEAEAIAIANAADVGLAGMLLLSSSYLLSISFSAKGIFNEVTSIISVSISFCYCSS